MNKKWIALLIGLLMLVLVAAASAETVGGVAWWSNVGGTFGSKDISWSLDRSTGEMTLTGKGSMGNYSLWGVLYRPWDNTIAGGKGDFVKEIKKVTVGEGITDIAEGAFSGCSNLISLTLPSTLEKIGKGAFRDCSSLTSIVIPDKVVEIGENAFYECSALVKVQLSKTLQRIGKLAFYNCKMLSSINIPSTVESIEEGAFMDTPKLMLNLDVYGFLGKSAFLRSGITGVTVHNCTGMTEGAFSACENLQSAKLDCDITVIPDGAFSYDTALRSINIPDSVQTVGAKAFTKCQSLSSITLPDKLATLGDEAFSYSGLKSIVVPDTVDLFGEKVFTGCKNLMTATLPNGLIIIPWATFQDCISLLKVNIPAGVTLIGNSAFYNCSSLQEVNLPEGLISVDWGAFASCKALRKAALPDSLSSIGESAFSGCESLQSISIPENIISIPESCFWGCEALISIKLPKELTTIASYAFGETKALTSIVLPDSLISIGQNAFITSGLTKVSIPVSLASVDMNAFSGCPIKTVQYAGTEKDWNGIMIEEGNEPLINAYKNPGTSDPEPEPEPELENKVEAYVTRCYKIILGRTPDVGGMKTWYNELTSGRKTASEIIDRFVNSPEYLNKNYNYGDSVDILYQAMLGRNADAGGKANWVNKLKSGQTLAHVINGFCFSKEFRDLCDNYGIRAGFVNIENTDTTAEGKIKAFVQRCYRIILDREADPSGMQTWYEQLSSGKKAAAEIIDRFVNSPEFSGKRYSHSDSVEILYKAMLGRGSDVAGKANWVSKLDAGQPFAVVINGFCVSKEFTGICASYGIKPGNVNIRLSAQSEEELSMLALNAKAPITRRSETKPNRVEIINPSDTIDMNIGTAVQAVYINDEKAKEFIGRCYRVILGREASEAEVETWISQMVNGTKTPDQIARGFLFSNEFKAKNVDNENLVKILYKVYMNRDADPEGLKTWTEKLDNGTSQKDLLDAFAKTSEFKKVVSEMSK